MRTFITGLTFAGLLLSFVIAALLAERCGENMTEEGAGVADHP